MEFSMFFDRVGKYWPETLSIVRIVIGLLFLEHGTAKLLGFPASSTAMPAMGTLIWFQGVIELAVRCWLFYPAGRFHPGR
jgi:putative oxidoreductase